jgi:hypothetical protein
MVNDLQRLKARIRDAVATITQNMLQATWHEVELLVNAILNLRFPQNNGIAGLAERFLASQEALCFTELGFTAYQLLPDCEIYTY